MKLIHVIPISRGIQKTELSYFTAKDVKDIEAGSVIYVPLRKRKVPAVISSVESVSDAKARLKAEHFAVKKISLERARRLLLPSFVRTAARTAEYFAAATGAVLYHALPKAVLDDPKHTNAPAVSGEKTRIVANEKLVLQADLFERLEQYRNLVREEFARGKSVFILTPTIEEAEVLFETLRRGIETYAVLLHGSLSKKEIRSRWNSALTLPHPILAVSTGTFLSLPRADINTIIVDREGSPYYKSGIRPFVDLRVFAELLSEERGARLILADLPIRVESAYRKETKELDELNLPKTRALSKVKTKIIDMRGKGKIEEGAKKTFMTLGNDLRDLVATAAKERERVFLFAARRGLSPMTVCLDCGNPVVCELRNIPLILYRAQGKNVFVCHEHGTVRSAEESCRFCGSWKLQSYGVGVEMVYDEIKKAFPDSKIFAIESKATPSHKEARETAERFYKEGGGILVGTAMALPYLTEPVFASAVVSIDSLLSIPEWNAYERVFSILLKIRSATEHMMIIQTRKPDAAILPLAAEGNLADFYRSEIQERKRFRYPPFFTFIKFQVDGTEGRVKREMESIAHTLAPYEFLRQDNLIRVRANTCRLQGFLRIAREKWPDTKLVSLIQSLSPGVTVTVDPESIL